MTNASTFGQRTLSALLAGATILWAVGIASLAVPQAAHAASPGDRIKSSALSAVYFYGYDGTRSTYPNLKTYETWHNGFDGVKTVSDSELSSLQLSGNVVYRPGSRWIKVDTAYETYAVSTNGTIHWIETEPVAVAYDGSSWNTNIDDVPDTFFVDYNVGASLMSATAFDGMMYMSGSDHYVVQNGAKRLVSAAGMSSNAMDNDFFLLGTGIDDSALTAGSDVIGLECDLVDASQTGCTTAVTPVSGDLTFSVSSATPAGATLPMSSNSVEVLTLNAKAGSSATTLNTIVAEMDGIGATTNITNAYLYRGNTRLTQARSINTSTRQVTFAGLNLALAAGETAALTVRVELAASGTATTGDQIRFSVVSASDVDATGTVNGAFPLSGNTFSIGGVSTGTITVAKNGSISNPSIGQNDATIAKFMLTANTEAASVQHVTLRVTDATDHSDLKLWKGATLLASGTAVGKSVSFDLSAAPVEIANGANAVLTVTADIGGITGRAVSAYVENNADVVAIGGTYGFGMGVTATTYDGGSCTSTSGDCSYSTTQGGDLTLAGNGPLAGTVSVNSQDRVLLNFSLTSAQDATIRSVAVSVYGDDDADNDPFDGVEAGGSDTDGLLYNVTEGALKDIKVINTATGTIVMGPQELSLAGNDAVQVLTFTDVFSMAAGETLNLAVTADVDNNTVSGTEYGAAVNAATISAEDVNGDAITRIVPAGMVQGNSQQALAATLTLALASTPGDVATVRGASAVNVASFSMVAGSGSDLNVSDVTFDISSSTDNSTFVSGGSDVTNYISSCSLYDFAGNQVGAAKSPETGGATIIFNNLNWAVPAGVSELLSLKCNFYKPTASAPKYFSFDVSTAGNIVAEDKDAQTVYINGSTATTDAIAVNGGLTPTNSTTVSVAGTLALTADSSTPTADILLAGSTSNLVSTFRLTATTEDWNVSTFTVAEKAAQVMGLGTDSSAYANNITTVTLEYPAADGSTKTVSTPMTGNEARFTNLDMLVKTGVPAKVNAFVSVPASDRNVGGYATSNERVRLGFFVDGTNDDNFSASGAQSGTSLVDSTSGAPTALTTGFSSFVVKKTKPTVTLSASTPSGVQKPIGDQEVLRFNVAASSNGDVSLDQIVFTMNASDNATSTWNEADVILPAEFDIYDLNNLGTSTALDVDGDWKMLASTGAESVAATVPVKFVKLDLTTPVVVPAGTTHTFALYFDTTGASATSDDSVQFGIAGDALATPIALGTGRTLAADFTISPMITTVTGSGALDTTATGAVNVGDILVFAGAEKVLVTAYTPAASTATVQRGYMGTTPALASTGAAITRIPSSFVWEDDGDSSTAVAGDLWGSYLVNDLPITGGAISF